MFNVFRRRSSQIKPHSILEIGIDRMVSQRDHHLSMMNQLETIINDAQRAYDQHTRLYTALNNSLFAINHPFDVPEYDVPEFDVPEFDGIALDRDIAAALDDFDADLSVDQPSDDERQAAAFASLPPHLKASLPLAPTPQELADAAPLDMPEGVVFPVRLQHQRKARATAAAQ